jgi:hypothetical protein
MLNWIRMRWRLSRTSKIIEKECLTGEHSRKIASEKEQLESRDRCLQKVFILLDEHDNRMRTDPAYAREHRKQMRRFNIYMFFHDYGTFKLTMTAPWRWIRKKFVN